MRYARRHSGRSPRLLVALERRICFTLADLDVRAPAYDCWRRLFHAAGEETAAQAAGGACGPGGSAAGRRGGRAGERQAAPPPPLPLVGRRIDVGGVPQRLHPYQRTAYLELWELQLQEDAAR